MKKLLFLFILILLPMLASAKIVSDVQNSGCLNKTRGEDSQRVPTIILTKEGSTLSVQLLNYESNCGTTDFNVTHIINNESGYWFMVVLVDPVIPAEKDCECPFNVSFTIHDLKTNSFYFNCWWYKGMVELTEGESLVLEYSNSDIPEYFPEGTKWTEIRLDTLKYDSWYSKVGDEWVPNFETIEYYVQGEYVKKEWDDLNIFKKVYTNGPEWTDSLTLLIQEGEQVENVYGHNGILVSVPARDYDGESYVLWPGEAYQFDWSVGKGLYYEDIVESNTTGIVRYLFYYGIIDEIKEGYFGGVRPLKYVDLDGKAPDDEGSTKNITTNGGRIIQGIGITEWNDGECLFGSPDPYFALQMFAEDSYPERHYRSMLVHFERDGEVLYDVWPEQTNGRKMLEQGKTWVYNYHHFEENEEEPPTETVYPVRYTIIGDTVIDNKSYYKMYQEIDNQKTYYAAYREEGLKVFVRYPHYDEDIIVADFEYEGLYDPNGDEEYDPYSAIKEYIDYIEVDGIQYRRHTYYENDKDNKLVIGVEGIGYTEYGLMYPSIYGPQPDCVCDFKVFSSCEVNGKCIFTADDFYVQTTTNPVDNITYRPFVEEGKVWKVGSTAGISDGIVKMVDYYYFDGDTIIDGKTCKQMMCQRYVSPNHPDYAAMSQIPSLRYVGAWYEEDKKVYIYNAINQFRMTYDFSLEANDTLFIDNQPYVIGPKQTGGLEGFKGVYRDIMWCFGGDPYYNYNTTWLEGVGGIDGPTVNVYSGEVGHGLFLMSCVVGDEVIYLNDEYEDGATPEGVRKKRFDFTHTIKTKPKARIKREKSDVYINSSERDVARPKVKARIRRGEAQSLYGEYNDQQLGINLDPLDDAYQVSITDESDKVVYEKAVNAGSIVALNIDISAYAKGLYTVTIENNNEVFTGEFGTETTGIQELKNSRIEKLKSIYNLQGQRLNSLQKGLNIVNGKKIFMTHDNYDK